MNTIFKRITSWSKSRGITAQQPNRNGFCANITEELGEYLEATKAHNENETIDSIADIIIFCTTELNKEGYDIELVLDEVLKVVESRIGSWDEENNKFQKDMSQKHLWHEADYTNCKRTAGIGSTS